MITFTPPTKLVYGQCFDHTHMHREVMDGNYAICDNSAQYWPITIEARTYEEAITMAVVTGSVGATAIQQDTEGNVVAEERWRRPKHAQPYGHRQDI
jgi:hypothetical protein